jgi:transposase
MRALGDAICVTNAGGLERYDKRRYRERWRIEATFCRLKGFRRIATRYDKLARNYISAVALAAIIAFWC